VLLHKRFMRPREGFEALGQSYVVKSSQIRSAGCRKLDDLHFYAIIKIHILNTMYTALLPLTCNCVPSMVQNNTAS
jgi:hypothetical protein